MYYEYDHERRPHNQTLKEARQRDHDRGGDDEGVLHDQDVMRESGSGGK